MDEARTVLQRLIEERGEDYSGLSRLLGRNAAYVQQFIKRGTPRRLAEEDRKRLARYFDISEDMLGGPAGGGQASPRAPVSVPLLDVGASAGAGAATGDERARGHVAFDPAWLRGVASGGPDGLSLIRVEGDSMLPSLAHGDEILVDRNDRRLRDGIYVLRLDGALLVKRLAFNPANKRVTIRSDNDAYPSWPDCDPAEVELVGRAVWVGRRLG